MSRREPLPPGRERADDRRARAAAIVRELQAAYPDAHCALRFRNPWELLVATILSAQCTDERVNEVTPALFSAYPGPAELAGADIGRVEDLIRPTGFFRNKARNIVGAAQTVVSNFDGEVPRTLPELITLPGVARKTANVVTANCFPADNEGIAVDTHVQRISRRLGLTREFEPTRIERDLMRLVPHEHWGMWTHWIIDHGRSTCTARTAPSCHRCPLRELCPSAERFLSLPTAARDG